MASRNRTEAILDHESTWPGASLELEDDQWLHGGRRIFVQGTGHTGVQVILPGGQGEERYEFRLTRAEVRRLLRLCIEHDLANIQPANRPGLPDEGQPRLRLTGWTGMSCTVWNWAGVEDGRFEVIYKELLRLEARIQGLTPTYKGRRDYIYKPRKGLSGFVWDIQKKFKEMRMLEVRDIKRFILDVLIVLIRLWPVYPLLILLFLIAFFWVDIDPAHTYGFAGAMAHGFFCVQNGILALFTGRHVWAPLNTGGWYTAGYMVGTTVLPFTVRTILEVIIALLKDTSGRRI
jgi:hypothetical protein